MKTIILLKETVISYVKAKTETLNNNLDFKIDVQINSVETCQTNFVDLSLG